MANGIRAALSFSLLSLVSLLSLAGCGSKADETPNVPKVVTNGLHVPGWELKGFVKADPGAAPDAVKQTHPQTAWVATYGGPVTAHARIWEISGSAVALELVQKWQPEPNTVVFYSDRYFTAVDCEPVDRKVATALVVALERALGPQRDNPRDN